MTTAYASLQSAIGALNKPDSAGVDVDLDADDILNGVGVGIAVVNEAGVLLRMNQSACLAMPGGTSPGDTLPVTTARDKRCWLAALSKASAGQSSMIQLDLGAGPIALTIARCAIGSQKPSFIVIFERRSLIDRLSLQHLATEYDLTRAECSVLKELVNGLVPKQIASRRRVAVSTVRAQIKQILMKTDQSNIGSLVLRVARFPSRDLGQSMQ